MSDAESQNRVTPDHRVAERGVTVAVIKNRVKPDRRVAWRGVTVAVNLRGVTPSDWVSVR